MSRILCILGMHRSGTSLTANWISGLGINIGDRLMPGGIGNDDGHYEDLDFHDLHEEIFRSKLIEHGGFISSDITISRYYSNKLSFLLKFKNSLNEQWGWKDPRTCIFIDSYLRIIEENKFDIKYIIVYREFESVVDSLIRRDFNNFQRKYKNKGFYNRLKFVFFKKKYLEGFYHRKSNFYLDSWIYYNKKIIESIDVISSENFVLCHYTDILKNEKEIYQQLKSWNFVVSNAPNFKEIYEPQKIKQKKEFNSFLYKTLDSKKVNVAKRMLELLEIGSTFNKNNDSKSF